MYPLDTVYLIPWQYQHFFKRKISLNFDLYEGLLMEKTAQIRQISQKENSKLPYIKGKFQ
jgi:hypothetical protein